MALYTDRHGVFRHTPGAGATGTATQFSRAMDELGVQMIFAQSPQAKGRVERTAGTFQHRMVTELRLAGATTIDEANAVLTANKAQATIFVQSRPGPRTKTWASDIAEKSP